MTRSHDQTAERKTIFYSIAAQPDNLGDIAIRKVVATWILETDLPVTVFAGSMPAAYVDAFDLPDRVSVIRGSRAFQIRLARQILRRRAHLVFAPGPEHFGGADRTSSSQAPRRQIAIARSLIRPLINLGSTLAVRCSGGHAVAIARSSRVQGRLARSVERARVRALNLYSTRDTATAAALGRPVRVVPDVAFFEDYAGKDDDVKDVVVISVRGDRTANNNAIRDAIASCQRLGLKPVILTQVKSDDAQHETIAQATGIPLISWHNETHAQQMDRVLKTYRQARFVISDRLHALIFGAQHGAIPIAIVHPETDKLTTTLRHLVPLGEVDASAARWSNLEQILTDDTAGDVLRKSTAAARASLFTLRSEIHRLLR